MDSCAPLVLAQRLRKGACGSPRGAKRLVGDAVKTGPPPARPRRPGPGPDGLGLLRPRRGPRGDDRRRARVGHRPDGPGGQGRDRRHRARTRGGTIKYPDAIFDEATGTWISKAEVAEVPYTAFASKKKADRVPGRLVVRRIPDVHADTQEGRRAGHPVRHLALPRVLHHRPRPSELDTVAADKTHRGHAIIEQVHADLKGSALAHLPSGKFTANSAWLVLAVIAFNLTRAAATLTGRARPRQGDHRNRASQADPRPARVASSARRITLHLPQAWPWHAAVDPTVRPRRRPTHDGSVLTTQPPAARPEEPRRGTPRQRGRAITHAPSRSSARGRHHAHSRRLVGGSRLSVRS